MTYAISAILKVGDRMLFRSTSVYPVLTRGFPNRVEIEMVKMPVANNSENTQTPLVGPTWLAEDIGGRGVIDNAQSKITFNPDGSMAGSGGCNSFRGNAEIDGARLKIGTLATTKKACVPALMDQERRFFAMLSEVRLFDINELDRKLFFKSGAGETLATFTKLQRAQ
jgi:putative lipoprotein